MRRVALVFLAIQLVSTAGIAAEPRIFIMGVWPNRLRLFDEKTEAFTDEMVLRHGAVTNYGVIPHTPNFDRLFFVTERMEAVEVVDPRRLEVVDEFMLSTPERRVRISAIIPDPTGRLLYLKAVAVKHGTDRFERDDVELLLYDLDARRVKETVHLPPEIQLGFFETLHVSPDGKSLFILGETIWELSTSSHEVINEIEWSKPRAPGYGGIRAMGITETAPSVFHGNFGTTDPFLEKKLWGVFRLDLNTKALTSFELGPAIDVDQFTLSPDGTRGFAGLHDLAVVDMKTQRVVKRQEGFERGRTNNVMIVSADGTKLYVTGVGNAVDIYDASSLEKIRSIFTGADIISPALALPRALFADR